MPRIKRTRNQEIVELRKSGWSFESIGEKYNITPERAYELFSIYATEADRLTVAAYPSFVRSSVIQIRIRPDLRKRLREHLEALDISAEDWLEQEVLNIIMRGHPGA
jgi:hypothetical protein